MQTSNFKENLQSWLFRRVDDFLWVLFIYILPSPHPLLVPLKGVSARMKERRVVAGSTDGSSTRWPFKANSNGFTETLESVVGRPIFDPYPHSLPKLPNELCSLIATSNVNYQLAANSAALGDQFVVQIKPPIPLATTPFHALSSWLLQNPKPPSNSCSAAPHQHGLYNSTVHRQLENHSIPAAPTAQVPACDLQAGGQ